jgi:hypothetical protein
MPPSSPAPALLDSQFKRQVSGCHRTLQLRTQAFGPQTEGGGGRRAAPDRVLVPASFDVSTDARTGRRGCRRSSCGGVFTDPRKCWCLALSCIDLHVLTHFPEHASVLASQLLQMDDLLAVKIQTYRACEREPIPPDAYEVKVLC